MPSSQHSLAYKLLCRRLKQARLSLGLTQTAAAKALRWTQSRLSAVERNQRKIDPIELLAFIKLYRKPYEWFVQDSL